MVIGWNSKLKQTLYWYLGLFSSLATVKIKILWIIGKLFCFKIMKDRKSLIVKNKALELLFIIMLARGWHVQFSLCYLEVVHSLQY